MNYDEYKNLLAQFVSLKSISTDPAYKEDIKKTVEWLKNLFESNKFSVELWEGPKSNPVVFAEFRVSEDADTILVYGHYDVQPANKDDGWNSEPFVLEDSGERLYARGVVDNKGQILIHVYTVIELIKQNRLNFNVKFLIEGNEETSNDDLGNLIKQNINKLDVDYVLVSDGEIVANKPVLEYSLRGGFNFKLEYTTADNNLHSGLYGGAVPNSAIELTNILSKMFLNNRFNISNFYDNVDPISTEQLDMNKKAIPDPSTVLNNSGVKTLLTEENLDFMSQVGLRPTAQITGFKSGYIGEGFSNIIPAKAEVRINVRTVSSQDEEAIIESIKSYVSDNTPDYVKYELTFSNHYQAVKVNVNSDIATKAKEYLNTAFEDEVILKPVGGGIPVVSDFIEHLKVDCLLISLGNEDCNMHGVNENFNASLVKKGLKFSELFFTGNRD